MRRLFLLSVFIPFLSCTEVSDNAAKKNTREEREFGLLMDHGLRNGFQYKDTAGSEWNYRYYTVALINDTTIPLRLEVSIPTPTVTVVDTFTARVFVLPRHLTRVVHQADTGMSDELKHFLDHEIGHPLEHEPLLKPKEGYVLTFGVLSPSKYFEITSANSIRLIPELKNDSLLSLQLRINDSLFVPCGVVRYR